MNRFYIEDLKTIFIISYYNFSYPDTRDHSTQFYSWGLKDYPKHYDIEYGLLLNVSKMTLFFLVRSKVFLCNKSFPNSNDFCGCFSVGKIDYKSTHKQIFLIGCCCQLNQTYGFELLLKKEIIFSLIYYAPSQLKFRRVQEIFSVY